MKKLTAVLVSTFITLSALAEDPFVGEYSGSFETNAHYFKVNPRVFAQISKPSKDTYKLILTPQLYVRATPYVCETIKDEGSDELKFGSDKAAWGFKISVDKSGKMKVSGKAGKDEVSAVLGKFERVSPTMGKAAPSGADVLIGGGNMDAWSLKAGGACDWKILDGGQVESVIHPAKDGKPRRDNTVFTKKTYGSFRLHLEFRLPEDYKGMGVPRCNSGLYIGPVEIQILDTFHGDAQWGDCGALYKFVPPRANFCLPPERWQTYDVEFSAAQFDENGEIVKYPRITAWHNGMKMYDSVELTQGTDHSQLTAESYVYKPGGLKISLQDHGDKIRFRNMWIEPLKD